MILREQSEVVRHTFDYLEEEERVDAALQEEIRAQLNRQDTVLVRARNWVKERFAGKVYFSRHNDAFGKQSLLTAWRWRFEVSKL